jgi:hypothetical protein
MCVQIAPVRPLLAYANSKASRFKNGGRKTLQVQLLLRAPFGRIILLASSNGKTTDFHPVNAGSIPAARSTSRFSDEDRGLQNRARGFNSLSALQAPVAQWKGTRLLSELVQVRVLVGALSKSPSSRSPGPRPLESNTPVRIRLGTQISITSSS